MNQNHDHIYRAFEEPIRLFAKVSPEGFRVGPESVIPALEGRISELRLRRKRFERSSLVCQSSDGVRSRNGLKCDLCRHPDCRPQLRIHLCDGFVVYTLDLGWTSAKNLLALVKDIEASGGRLVDWPLRLTVVPHEHWGEVRFERLP